MKDELKPIVVYRTDMPHFIRVDASAMCYPVDHPSHRVTADGKTPARTSRVVRHNEETGEFWTENTHYVPVYGAP